MVTAVAVFTWLTSYYWPLYRDVSDKRWKFVFLWRRTGYTGMLIFVISVILFSGTLTYFPKLRELRCATVRLFLKFW